jgi:periplasmic protein TonB
LSNLSVPAGPTAVRQFNRNLFIGGSVVLFHVAALWALQSGLLRRAVEVVVPVAILSEVVRPPEQKTEPALPVPQPKPPAPVKQLAAPRASIPRPAPQPAAIPDSLPAPSVPTGVVAAQPPAPPVAASVAAEPAPPVAAPPPTRFEAPTVDADYAANNDVFRPPAISERLGEHGTVLLRVTVGVNGQATHVEVKNSSGYPRLDNAALQGTRRLKFRPATRGGVAVEASYDLPVKYMEPR